MHVKHPLLQEDRVEFRGYQANLARIAHRTDTLVVLPTGLGKTIVALLTLADALKEGPKRILLMAPTKPLVEQHAAFFSDMLAGAPAEQVRLLTGHVAPAAREQQYLEPGIVCATPQVVANDIVAERLDVKGFDWVVYDEAHRAVGEYPYAFIGRAFSRRNPKVRRLGLTASPGHDVAKIEEVRQNLALHHVEVRTPQDADVAPYMQDVEVQWETLPLPPAMGRVSRRLQDALAERVRVLRKDGWLEGGGSRPGRRALLEAGHKLQARTRMSSEVPPEVYGGLSLQAQAMKLLHAIELAETQGAEPFRAFIDKMKREADGAKVSKATLSLLHDKAVNEAYQIARFDRGENPKLGRTEVLVRERIQADPKSLCIVFANYRSTVDGIAQHLNGLPEVRAASFVGQGKRGGHDGLNQRQQKEVLDDFRAGRFNVLVATSVAEEGLDVPATDLVVFYEPIASEIRSIQRRGRTGRHRAGQVVVLMTKGTQDEAAHWSARRKEQQMIKELQHIRAVLGRGPGPTPGEPAAARPSPQTRLDEPPPAPPSPPVAQVGAGPKIVCDNREQAGGVVRRLHEMGVSIDGRNLEVGDFVLSDRVAVERKDCKDFVDSLVDGRLFDQLKALQVYPKPLLLLEGEGLYGHRNVSPEALMAALASISVDLGVPVVQTRDASETARFLVAVAKREQTRGGRRIALRPGRQAMTDLERLRFIVAGFPNIDESRAEALLRHFGSLAALFAAPEGALAKVPGIGAKTASDLRRLLELPYLTETVSMET